MNITDRMIVTLKSHGTKSSIVLPREEAQELISVFDEMIELAGPENDVEITSKYLTNKEYLVLVNFNLVETGIIGALAVENAKRALALTKVHYNV